MKLKQVIHILRVIWLPILLTGCLEGLELPVGDFTIEGSHGRANQTCGSGDAPWLGHSGSFNRGQAQYADVSGDGRADLIYQTNDNKFFVSLAKTDGSFSTPRLRMQHGGNFLKGQAQYADVSGDGRADLIFRGFDNRFWVSLAVECGFTAPQPWLQHGGPFYIGQAKYPDFNGDGRADVVYQGADNHYWLSESTGNGFTPPRWIMAHGGGFIDGQTQYADVNGDNRDDLIFQTPHNEFWISLSNGHSYSSPQPWLKHGGHFVKGQAQYPDLNGDGKADLAFQGGDNRFWISLSSGGGFSPPQPWVEHGGGFTVGQAQFADVNGDKKDDLVFQGGNNGFWVSLSFGSYFTTPDLWYDYRGTFSQGQAQLADTNGDGMADLLFQSTANVFGDSASTGAGFESPKGWQNYARSLVRLDSTYFPSAVVIIPSPAGEHQHGVVVIPQGTLLDTNASTTSGFNEAIEYSMFDGRDIFVYGKGKFSATGNYHFDSPIEFPAIQGKTVQMYDVTLNFGPGVTGSAIVFDSSMMGDFQIFGTINAPYAEYGVQLLPRNPHPLDGCAYGIDSAIVGSRFYFDNIITASPNIKKVGFPRQSWLDQLTGNLDELGGVVSNTLYIGDGIDDYGAAIENHAEFVRPGAMNVLKDNRRKKSLADPDDPANEVYHDIFQPNAVVIQAPMGEPGDGVDSIGRVYLPDGTEVDISDSLSSGLKEAATLSTELDTELFVYGRGMHGGIHWIEETKINGKCDSDKLWEYVNTVINPTREVKFTKGAHNLDWSVVTNPPPKGNGIYDMREGIIFEHINNRSVILFTATFNVSAQVNKLFYFKEANNAFFEFTGQAVGHTNAEDIFYFEPLNADIVDSTFYLGTSLAQMHNVYFNTQNGSIMNNQFFLHEMNMAKHSVTIGNPSAHHEFANNYLEAAHIHSFSDIAIQVGENPVNADHIKNNRILAIINSDGKPINLGLQIWAAGGGNVYPDLDLTGDFNRGVSIEPGASGNTIYYKRLDGRTPVFMADGTEDSNSVQPH